MSEIGVAAQSYECECAPGFCLGGAINGITNTGRRCKATIPWVGDKHDPVNHPKHYTSHPSGVECIQVTEHFGFNLGNVIKYLWRAEEKGAPLEDLKKAAWYLNREIEKRERK